MKKTINQLDKELENLTNSHLILNGYYFGDIATSISEEGAIYPAMYCNIVAGSFDNFYTYFNIELFACDLVSSDDRELNEVESDTVQNLRDYYEIITKSDRWKSFSKVTNSTIPTRKFQDRLPDLVTGWGMTINVGVNTITGVCDLPIDGYPQGGDTCAPVTILLNGQLYEIAPSGSTVNVITGEQTYDLQLVGSTSLTPFTGLVSGDQININGLIITL